MMIAVNGKAMNDRPSIVDASIVDDSLLERNENTFPVSLNREDEHDRVSDGMIKKKITKRFSYSCAHMTNMKLDPPGSSSLTSPTLSSFDSEDKRLPEAGYS
ncbi:hypothetical protein F2Q69_00024156 [Brassica cretica]|uniref:Uncharacterized protein n=1 Tax=Brassica cretica TaxID=69181 RepID=A0A8S9QFS9_BRACR|nr:hypothetical protein F2Q69_00024156 [Brassica cretica]